MSIKIGVSKVTRVWMASAPQVVYTACKCGLGCQEKPTTWGYNRHMDWVPLALGHGRKLGDGS